MSLELKKEIMKPKSPADMAFRYWKKEAKIQRERYSLKHFYLQKQMCEMFNIPMSYLNQNNLLLAVDPFKELSKNKLESDYRLFFMGNDIDLKRNIEKTLEATEIATEKYTSKVLVDLSVSEKIDAMLEAFKIADIIAKNESTDPEVKVGAIEDVKNIAFAASTLFISGSDKLKEDFRKSSKNHFGSASFFEENIAVGMNSDYLKARINKAFSMIGNNQFENEINNGDANDVKVVAKKNRSLKLKK